MLKDKEFRNAAMWLVFWLFVAPAGVGLAWQEWKDYRDSECQKSRECREREAERARYVVDHGEMPDSANMNHYRGN